jgi:hypothetical protein
VDPATGASNALTYAMYHPAAALRAGALKRTMLEDMCGLPQALLDSRERRQPTVTDDVAQDTITERDEQAADEPVALDVEPELIAVAIAQDPLADPVPVDENQISLF